MYKRILFSLIAIIALMLNACSEKETHNSSEVSMVFTAIAMEENNNMGIEPASKFMWTPGDEICVFYGSSKSARFSTQIQEPAVQAEFTGSVEEYNDVNQFWAIYPYESGVSCDGSGVVAYLSHEQSATSGTNSSNIFLALAKSLDSSISFYNVCSGLLFTVNEEGIESVTFQGNNNEDVAGKFYISIDTEGDGKPTQPVLVTGQKSITLCPPEGETFQVGQKYCFAILPQNFSEGITLTFNTATGSVSRRSSQNYTFERAAFGYSLVTDQEVYILEDNSQGYMYEIIDEDNEDFDSFIVSASGTHYLAVGDDEEYGKACVLGSFNSEDENIVAFMDETGILHKIVFLDHCLDFYYHENDGLVDILHIDGKGVYEWLTNLELDLVHYGSDAAQSYQTKTFTPYVFFDNVASIVGLVTGKGVVGKLIEGIGLIANVKIPDEYELFTTIVDIHLMAVSAAFIPAFGPVAVSVGMALIAIQTTHAIITAIQNGIIKSYLPHVTPITKGFKINDYNDVTLTAGVDCKDNEYNNDFQVGIILAGNTFISKHHCIEYKETSFVISQDLFDFSFYLSNNNLGSRFQYVAFLEPNQKSDRYTNHKHILDYCKYGETETFTIPVPTANTDRVFDISLYSAKVSCSYGNILPSARCGVEVTGATASLRYYGSPDAEGKAVIELVGLQPHIEYDCRAFVEVKAETFFANESRSFTTALLQPSAYTGDILSVTEKSATVGCLFSNVPDGATCGVIVDSKRIITASQNDTSVDIDGLDPGTNYNYCAFVWDNDTFYYGDIKTVTTSLPDITGTWYCSEVHINYMGQSTTVSYTVNLNQDGAATSSGDDMTYEEGGWSQTKDKLNVWFSNSSSTMMEGLSLTIVFDDFRNPRSGTGTANRWWYQYSIGREGGDYFELKMTR